MNHRTVRIRRCSPNPVAAMKNRGIAPRWYTRPPTEISGFHGVPFSVWSAYSPTRLRSGIAIGLLLSTARDQCELDNGEVARLLLWPVLSAAILWFALVLVLPPQPLRGTGWRYVFATSVAVSAAAVVAAIGLGLINTADCRG